MTSIYFSGNDGAALTNKTGLIPSKYMPKAMFSINMYGSHRAPITEMVVITIISPLKEKK